MPDPAQDPPPAGLSPSLPFQRLLTAVSQPVRWRILSALAGGIPLFTKEISTRVGCSADSASKHLAVLRRAGVVINPRGRLYELAPGLLVDKENALVDLGYCVLRLKTTPEK